MRYACASFEVRFETERKKPEKCRRTGEKSRRVAQVVSTLSQLRAQLSATLQTYRFSRTALSLPAIRDLSTALAAYQFHYHYHSFFNLRRGNSFTLRCR